MSLGLIFLLAAFGLVFFLSARMHKMKASTAQMCFWIYSALFGRIRSTYFLVYTGESIARVFFITAATFGAMSLYGYTTKRDLTGLGAFLFMGMIGLLIAIVVNISRAWVFVNTVQFRKLDAIEAGLDDRSRTYVLGDHSNAE